MEISVAAGMADAAACQREGDDPVAGPVRELAGAFDFFDDTQDFMAQNSGDGRGGMPMIENIMSDPQTPP
jgi:hypothetical protein